LISCWSSPISVEIKSRPGRLSRWAAPAWISRSHRRTAVAQASGAVKPVSVQVQGSQACRRDESVLALHPPGLLRFAGHGVSFVVVVLRALVSPDRIDEVNIFVGISGSRNLPGRIRWLRCTVDRRGALYISTASGEIGDDYGQQSDSARPGCPLVPPADASPVS